MARLVAFGAKFLLIRCFHRHTCWRVRKSLTKNMADIYSQDQTLLALISAAVFEFECSIHLMSSS